MYLSSIAKVFGAERSLDSQASGGVKNCMFPSTPIEVVQREKNQEVLVRIKLLLLSNSSGKKAQLEKICCDEMDQLSIDGQLAMAELVVSAIPNTARHLFWRVGCNLEASSEQVLKAAKGLSKLKSFDCAVRLYKWVLTQSDITFRKLCDIGQAVKVHAPDIATITCCQAALWLPLENKTPIITYLVKNQHQALIPATNGQTPSEATMEDLTMIADGVRTIDEKLRIEILRLSVAK